MSSTDIPLRDDLLTGAEEISDFLGPSWPLRKVYHAARCGHLPISKSGHILTASKRRLSEEIFAKSAAKPDDEAVA
jgi:hypothetical protein